MGVKARGSTSEFCLNTGCLGTGAVVDPSVEVKFVNIRNTVAKASLAGTDAEARNVGGEQIKYPGSSAP